MSISVKPTEIIGAKQDERLTYLLNQTVNGVDIFTKAIRDSPDACEMIGFKAFVLKSKSKEEVDAVFDLIMTKVGLELHEHSKDLVDKYTFFHETNESEDNCEEFNLFLYCKKVAPPSKEEIDKRVKEEQEAKEQEAKEQEAKDQEANEQEKIDEQD
jgi:hypothetical protein